MKLIVAVDKKWGIGKKNGLLFSLKEDMRYFKEKTMNKIVCMGYNTLLSFPNSKPLPHRVNIVLAPKGVVRDDCIVVYSLDELFSKLNQYPTDDIFVIGGGMFYRTMYPYCDKAYITKVDADGGAEVFFDNLDELENWTCALSSETIHEGDYQFSFTEYVNSKPLKY